MLHNDSNGSGSAFQNTVYYITHNARMHNFQLSGNIK